MGNNDGIALLLLGLGALYLMGGTSKRAAGSQPAYYPGYSQLIYFPSSAPLKTINMEGVAGGPSRPDIDNRLVTRKINGKTYHVDYTKEEKAWRRAQPATSIGRGGGGRRR